MNRLVAGLRHDLVYDYRRRLNHSEDKTNPNQRSCPLDASDFHERSTTLEPRGKTLDGRLRVTVIAILTFIVAAGIVTTSTVDWG